MHVPPRPLRVAMVGTRGVPARYGGFETAVEEVGRRLVAQGHEVTVYCRPGPDDDLSTHLGMRRVVLPAVRHKYLETLAHTALSVLHLVRGRRPDAVLVFNAANAPILPLLRWRGLRVATHVDGLEWQRDKWSGLAKRYYRLAESLAVRWSDRLIADAQGISTYYTDEFGVSTDQISYGAPIQDDPDDAKVRALDLIPGGYHLVVARFEPENHVDLIVDGYLASRARLPLVVVGSAPYSSAHVRRIEHLADRDPRVLMLGGVWDQEQLDQLYAHALTYLHGHSVGGTNPSLLRAMGAGTAVVAYDVVFNREVLGPGATSFTTPLDLAHHLEAAERDPRRQVEVGALLRERARERYDWDDVAGAYADLCLALADGRTQRGTASGHRTTPATRTALPAPRSSAADDAAVTDRPLVVGYVPGVYDMFHVGHLNILRRARAACDVLVVGAVTDEVVTETKGQRPVVPLAERMEILSGLSIVDRVVADDCTADKLPMWGRLGFDVLFKGDDWRGTPKGDLLESSMAAVGARVEYLPYTPGTSSTLLRELLTNLE